MGTRMKERTGVSTSSREPLTRACEREQFESLLEELEDDADSADESLPEELEDDADSEDESLLEELEDMSTSEARARARAAFLRRPRARECVSSPRSAREDDSGHPKIAKGTFSSARPS